MPHAKNVLRVVQWTTGNVAAEAVPMTLAHIQSDIQRGQNVRSHGLKPLRGIPVKAE